MSNKNNTTWIFQMIDKVTSPIKGVVNQMKSAVKGVKDIGNATKFTEKQTKEALLDIQKYHKDLKVDIKNNTAELKKLEQAYKKAKPGVEFSKAKQLFEAQKQKVDELNNKLQETEFDLKDINRELDVFKSKEAQWTMLATRINQTSELISKAVRGLKSAADTNTLLGNVEKMTELYGESADEFVYHSNRIASIYSQDASEVAKLANAMTKQLGGSYESNFKLIEQGFKKGADLNGDFVQSLQSNIPVLKDMGMSGEYAIALMAKAAKEGYDPNKILNSMTNASDAINKMTDKQAKALKMIGLEAKDFVGKTTFEAVQMVSISMQGMETQAKQNVLAQIFGQAGVDSGQDFIESLANEMPNLAEMPELEETASGLKAWFSDLKTWAGLSFGGVAVYAQELEPMIQTVSAAIPIISMLRKVTWLQNIATTALSLKTKILGITIMGTPIGWIIGLIAGLIAIVVLCWNKFEGFRKVIFKGWEAMKLFGSVIKDYVIDRLKGVLSGITGIGQALFHFFKGDWKKAWETGTKAVDDLMGLSAGEKAYDNFKSGWDGAMDEGQKKSDAYTKKKNSKKTDSFSVNEYLSPKGKVIGYNEETIEDDKKKTKGTKSEGSSIDGGMKGGIKSIAMTLNITNNFSVSKDTNMRQVADGLVGMVNDRLRDSLINIG